MRGLRLIEEAEWRLAVWADHFFEAIERGVL
jgi:hypothetical protein